MSRKRADLVLVERGFFASRARAQEAITAGLVTVNGTVVRKASDAVPARAQASGVDGDAHHRGVLAAPDGDLADVVALRPHDGALESLDPLLLGQRRGGEPGHEGGDQCWSHGSPSIHALSGEVDSGSPKKPRQIKIKSAFHPQSGFPLLRNAL
jgi:hypothetical protein